MRVAVFTETFLPKIDGIVTVVCLMLDSLARRGIESVIVAADQGIARYANTEVIGVPGFPCPPYPELKLGIPTLRSYRQVKAFKPDLMHYIHPTLIGTGGLVMGKRLKVPLLTSFHIDLVKTAQFLGYGYMGPLLWWYMRRNFNVADYSLAPSKAMQTLMVENGIRNVGLWRRGVDIEKFDPAFRSAEMRDRLSDGHPDEPILLYVGRLSPEKQIEQLKSVLDQVPGVRLAIVGDGPHRAALEAHFAGTPTQFLGYMTGTPLSEAYASADIFTFTSASETFGLVVVEAMAAGLPVVASRVGGVMDVVQPGVNGYSFTIDDIPGLIEGVRQIVATPGARERMGRAGRAFAETQTWPSIMDEMIDCCYMPLLEGKRPTI